MDSEDKTEAESVQDKAVTKTSGKGGKVSWRFSFFDCDEAVFTRSNLWPTYVV